MDTAGLITEYSYLFLFVGMFVLGETVFLPAAYFSLNGMLNPWIVLVISILATLISDFIWYYIAQHVPTKKIKNMSRVKKHQHTFNRLSSLFDVYGYHILFISKFIYGTRILTQLIAGAKKMSFSIYLLINLLGTASYLGFLFLIAKAVDVTQARFVIGGVKSGIISVLLLAIIINICIHYIAKKKMSL